MSNENNFIPNLIPYKVITPFRLFIKSNFPFIENTYESLDNYGLYCKIVEYLNKVIANENTVEENMQLLYNSFVSLNNYVSNYFDNLDVQDEINNKLDELADSGYFDSIIESYISSNISRTYENVSLMLSDLSLKNGDIVETKGYYEINDKGKATYYILDDEPSTYYETLENGKYALLLKENEMNPFQFGAKGDGTDDYTAIQNAINYCATNKLKLNGLETHLYIGSTINIPCYLKLANLFIKPTSNANLTNNYLIFINTTNGSSWIASYPEPFTFIDNIELNNLDDGNLILNTCHGILNFANIIINGFNSKGLNKTFTNSTNYLDIVQLKDINIYRKNGNDYAIYMGFLGDGSSIDTAHIHDTSVNSESNIIETGMAKFPLTLNNIINGNIKVGDTNGGPTISITNSHIGEHVITAKNSNIHLENLNFRHITGPNIVLNNCKGIINNCQFRYFLKTNSYQYIDDTDISISNNTDVSVNKCYKDIVNVGAAESHLLNICKIIDNNTPLTKTRFSNNTNIDNSEISVNRQPSGTTDYNNAGTSGTYAKWFKESNTYYYATAHCFDYTRKLFSGTVQHFNQALTLNGDSFAIKNCTPFTNVIVFRGIADRVYSQYAIIPLVGTFLADNGYSINGYNWKDRISSGDVESYTNCRFLKNNGDGTIFAIVDTVPATGSWTEGDIIKINNSSDFYIYTNNEFVAL